MSAAAAADEDYALSFDNINGTAFPNATWPGRPVIGKTGTLGNGNSASEAWFVGAIPQYAMAIGLWTNTQTQNLDNLPGARRDRRLLRWRVAGRDLEGVHGDPVREAAGGEALPTPNYAGFNKWIHGGATEAEEAGLLARASSRTAPANMATIARTRTRTQRRVKGRARGAAAAVAAVAGAAARQRQR